MSKPQLSLSVRYVQGNQCVIDQKHVEPVDENKPRERRRGFTLGELTKTTSENNS